MWAGDDLEIWTREARLTRGAHGKNDKGPFSAHARSNRPGKVKTATELYRTERSRRVGHMSEPRRGAGRQTLVKTARS